MASAISNLLRPAPSSAGIEQQPSVIQMQPVLGQAAAFHLEIPEPLAGLASWATSPTPDGRPFLSLSPRSVTSLFRPTMVEVNMVPVNPRSPGSAVNSELPLGGEFSNARDSYD